MNRTEGLVELYRIPSSTSNGKITSYPQKSPRIQNFYRPPKNFLNIEFETLH